MGLQTSTGIILIYSEVLGPREEEKELLDIVELYAGRHKTRSFYTLAELVLLRPRHHPAGPQSAWLHSLKQLEPRGGVQRLGDFSGAEL